MTEMFVCNLVQQWGMKAKRKSVRFGCQAKLSLWSSVRCKQSVIHCWHNHYDLNGTKTTILTSLYLQAITCTIPMFLSANGVTTFSQTAILRSETGVQP